MLGGTTAQTENHSVKAARGTPTPKPNEGGGAAQTQGKTTKGTRPPLKLKSNTKRGGGGRPDPNKDEQMEGEGPQIKSQGPRSKS